MTVLVYRGWASFLSLLCHRYVVGLSLRHIAKNGRCLFKYVIVCPFFYLLMIIYLWHSPIQLTLKAMILRPVAQPSINLRRLNAGLRLAF